jgi:RNA recognition motif-containing protein
MHIFVGNLAWGTTEEDLAQFFHLYGEIVSVRILLDRDTNRSRGFGFVEMPEAMEGNAAIADLNGTLLGGRPLTVNEARQREERDGPRRGACTYRLRINPPGSPVDRHRSKKAWTRDLS